MPVSGGVFTRKHDWTDDRDNTINIDAGRMDESFDDIASALSTAIYKDGQQTYTADQPMGSNKLTGLGSGSAGTDSLTLAQAQAQAFIWCGTAGGTADAITLTPSPAITAYAAGQTFRFIAASGNTGAVTIAVSGLTATAAQSHGEALYEGLIQSGQIYEALYTGSAFEVRAWSIAPPVPSAGVMDNTLARFDGAAGRVQGTDFQLTDGGTLDCNYHIIYQFRMRAPFLYDGGAVSSSNGTLTLNALSGPYLETTLTENISTLTITKLAADGLGISSILLKITQSAASSYTIAWAANGWNFGDAGEPDLSALSSETWVLLWTPDGGTSKYASKIFQDTI